MLRPGSGARHRAGVDEDLQVLDARRSPYAAQQALIALCLQDDSNRVALYAVPGGGADATAVAPPRRANDGSTSDDASPPAHGAFWRVARDQRTRPVACALRTLLPFCMGPAAVFGANARAQVALPHRSITKCCGGAVRVP